MTMYKTTFGDILILFQHYTLCNERMQFVGIKNYTSSTTRSYQCLTSTPSCLDTASCAWGRIVATRWGEIKPRDGGAPSFVHASD